jgi:hypothetical protein
MCTPLPAATAAAGKQAGKCEKPKHCARWSVLIKLLQHEIAVYAHSAHALQCTHEVCSVLQCVQEMKTSSTHPTMYELEHRNLDPCFDQHTNIKP